MYGHGQAVQRVTHDDRLDPLDVHDGVRHTNTEEIVRLWIWAERGEGGHVNRLVVQYLVAVARRADFAQLRDAVAVIINADIVFNVQHLTHRRIVALVHLVCQRGVARVPLDVGVHVVVGG